MSYLTVDEFRERVPAGDLTALLGDVSGAAADALIAACIEQAGQTLDGYADARYVTPLASTAQVEEFAFRLAWFALLRRKNWNFGEAEREDEKMLLRELDKVGKRALALVSQTERGDVNRATSIPESPDARVTGRPRIFTRDDMGF